MTTEKMPITPAVLAWARARAGYSVSDIELLFSEYASWEFSDGKPTYSQLEKLADKFKTPIAVFFFPDAPSLPSIEQTFRTVSNTFFSTVPPRIKFLLRKARAFQISLAELNDGKNPARRAIVKELPVNIENGLAETAQSIRGFLEISIERQIKWQNVETALEYWREVFADAGIYVFKDSFEQDEFSGFCLYDDEFPIIYVNNSQAKSRQIFTLFHELTHLLLKTSGIDKGSGVVSGADLSVEVYCNLVASEVLLPTSSFNAEILSRNISRERAEQVASKYNVSRELVYRKARDRGFITQAEYEDASEAWRSQKGSSSGGGSWYWSKISYLGSRYIGLAFDKYYRHRITGEELAEHLDVKQKNLGKLEEQYLRKVS